MNKVDRLKEILRGMKRVVVAYSGGLDSTFLLKAAIDTLGKDNVLAVTARSETYPASEYKEAISIAKKFGAKHITINTRELNIKNFRSNPVNRCYYCKKELFKRLNAIKKRYGMKYVVDGTNLDDLKDIRHGSKAAEEEGVKRPLLKADITKDDIRKFSKNLRLPTWDKPSFACLASRFPFNDRITIAGLKRIEEAEGRMRRMGFKQVRVRLHGKTARIEVPEDDLSLGIKLKDKVIKELKSLGFIYVTLDLEGYRTGSMHEAAVLTKR
ncbi:MAG: ATP-dependent sacrificial sulfur transferase LarE [Candidatus Omnitrophica bacterium]|nr:ATP-dependent sacrificial sulfur transferase LarE [Candidatus Omnitrophota bacterium]